MPGFFVIERQNLQATIETVKMLPGAGEVTGVEHVDENGIPKDDGKYQLISVSGNGSFVDFALRNQGYARVVKSIV